MRVTVAPLVAIWAVLLTGACSPSNDAGIRAREPASAPAAAPLDPAFAGNILARGTEPFWAVQVRARALTLKRPGFPDVSVDHDGPRMEGDAAVWGGDAFQLTLRKGTCSDGMSDNAYPMTAEALIAGETFKGCAAPG